MTVAALGITVRVGSATLLSDVSVEVRPGEVVAIAGPNGAGKSTLIRVLAGDVRPAGGTLLLAGRPLAAWPRLELARRRAVMGTDPAVAFGFSAEDVALMGRLPLHGGKPREVDRAVVRSLLEAVDCAHLADRVFGTLSSGERQRVALARALAQVSDGPTTAGAGSTGAAGVGPSPGAAPATGARAAEAPAAAPGSGARAAEARFLLLDEPTSSLDPAHQHLAMRLLRREADAGRGVLAVLHDLNLAAAYADRLVLMAGGRVVAAGTPAEVLRPDLLESVFGVGMLVIADARVPHPLVVAEPRTDGP